MQSQTFNKDCVMFCENSELDLVHSDNITHIFKNTKHNKHKPIPSLNKINLLDLVNNKKNHITPTNFLIIGKRSSRANYLIDEIILEFKKSNVVDKVNIYSSKFCELDIKTFSDLYPNDIFIKYRDNKLDYDYLNILLENQSKPDSTPLLLIFDDIITSREVNSKIIDNMIKYAYHYKLYIIMYMQYPMKQFNNFDFCMVYQEDFHSNLKRLYEYYFSSIGRFNLFNEIMKKYCSDNKILIINNFSDNDKIEDKLFEYNVKIPENIKEKEVQIKPNKITKNSEINYEHIDPHMDSNKIIQIINDNNKRIQDIMKQNEYLCGLLSK